MMQATAAATATGRPAEQPDSARQHHVVQGMHGPTDLGRGAAAVDDLLQAPDTVPGGIGDIVRLRLGNQLFNPLNAEQPVIDGKTCIHHAF